MVTRIAAVIVAVFLSGVSAVAEDLRIGLLFPSPRFGDLGPHMKAAAELAANDINQSRTLRDKVIIASQREYDTPDQARAGLHVLWEMEKVDVVVGPGDAAAGLAVQDVVRRQKIPLFLVVSRIPAASAAPGTFQFSPDDDEVLDKVVNYLRSKLANKPVVLVCERPQSACDRITTTFKEKLGQNFQGSKTVDLSSAQKEVVVVAASPNSPLIQQRPHQDNTVVAATRPEAGLLAREFWPVSITYNEAVLSTKLREALRAKGASGNVAAVMAAHQVYAAVEIASRAWNEARDRDRLFDALQTKRDVNTVLGSISIDAGLLICPNCTGQGGCTYPKEPCKDDTSKCCDKKP